MSADPNKKSARSFQCRDVLWETFEQMARELECSVDYLINEAMKQYARQRSQGQRPGTGTGTPPPVRADELSAAGRPPMSRNEPLSRDARDAREGAGGASGPSYGGHGGGLGPPQRGPLPQPGQLAQPMASASGIGGGIGGAGRLPPPPARGGAQLPAPPPRHPTAGMGAAGLGGGVNQTSQGLGPAGGGGLAPPPGYPAARAPYGSQQPLQPSASRSAPPPRSVPPPVPRNATPSPFQPQPQHQPALSPPQQNGGYAQPNQGQLSVIYQGDKLSVNKDRFVIGRGKQSSDLTLKDPNVSRQHAMVEFQNGVYFMVDMGSTNGVEYNGQRIARKPIAEGDVFRICDHDLRFTYR